MSRSTKLGVAFVHLFLTFLLGGLHIMEAAAALAFTLLKGFRLGGINGHLVHDLLSIFFAHQWSVFAFGHY